MCPFGQGRLRDKVTGWKRKRKSDGHGYQKARHFYGHVALPRLSQSAMSLTIPSSLAKELRQTVMRGDRLGAKQALLAWICRELPELLRRSTPMLCWHALPWTNHERIWQGGSAFLIRTPARILGVTARHVVEGYINLKRSSRKIEAQLGGLRFDLEERVISQGKKVDIATFCIEESDLRTVGYFPLEGAWPPTAPQPSGLVVFAGWPGHERVITPRLAAGGMWTGFGNAGLSSHQITIVIDHSQGLLSPIPGVPTPPPNFDVGGISGGPVMAISLEFTGMSVDWKLSGVLHEGRPEYDQVMAELADIIQDDGRVAG